MKDTYIGAVLVLLLSTLSLSAERVSQTYDIKWRDVEKMAELIEGFVDGHVKYSRHFNALVVRTDPADHELIAKLIEKYDTPPKRVEFQYHILGALRDAEGGQSDLPPEITQVVTDIASLTRYERFELLSSPVIRVREGGILASLSGQVRVETQGIRVIETSDGRRRINVDEFLFEARAPLEESREVKTQQLMGKEPKGRRVAYFVTSFTIDDGETIVLGSSEIEEGGQELGDAVIIVVTARVL